MKVILHKLIVCFQDVLVVTEMQVVVKGILANYRASVCLDGIVQVIDRSKGIINV
jgi:hypothetical protein